MVSSGRRVLRTRNPTHAVQKRHSPSNTNTALVSVAGIVVRVLLSVKMLALHLFTIVLVGVMISLGFWQLDRHNERDAFNDAVRSRAQETPRSPDEILSLSDNPSNLEWYPLATTGEYLVDANLLLVNVSQDGQAGVDPVAVLQLDDGRLLLVNRGFVPLAQPVPAPPEGRVTIVGRVRTSDERERGELSDAAEGPLREIQRIDVARLAPQLPGKVLPIYVDLLGSNPADSPMLSRIADPQLTLGPHLSYVMQWWIFSLCAVVAWALIVRRALAADRRATTSV
jgi:cytochrome oxidase assembly protein ShyY1